MKKRICILLAAMKVMLCGCGENENNSSNASPASEKQNELIDSSKGNVPEQTTAEVRHITTEEVTLRTTEIPKIEKEIYSDRSISVRFLGLESGYSRVNVNLMIENKSGKNLTIFTENLAVNGVMNDGILYADVSSGNRSYESISLRDLDRAGITESSIRSVEFRLHYYDADNWEDLNNDVETKTIKINV